MLFDIPECTLYRVFVILDGCLRRLAEREEVGGVVFSTGPIATLSVRHLISSARGFADAVPRSEPEARSRGDFASDETEGDPSMKTYQERARQGVPTCCAFLSAIRCPHYRNGLNMHGNPLSSSIPVRVRSVHHAERSMLRGIQIGRRRGYALESWLSFPDTLSQFLPVTRRVISSEIRSMIRGQSGTLFTIGHRPRKSFQTPVTTSRTLTPHHLVLTIDYDVSLERVFEHVGPAGNRARCGSSVFQHYGIGRISQMLRL